LIGHIECLKYIIQLKLMIVRELIRLLSTDSRYKASITVTIISPLIDKTEEIGLRINASLVLDNPDLVEVLEHLGAELVNDRSDLSLEILAHLLQHKHVLGKEQTHQSRVHKLMVSHKVVTRKDADVGVKGEEHKEKEGPHKLREER
jgi:hypothetical protein